MPRVKIDNRGLVQTAGNGPTELASGHKNTVILSGGGTTTLTAADSGATCVFNVAAASNFTLPAPEKGMRFTFVNVITATADHVIQAATNDHGFLGGMTYTQLTSTAADQCDSFSTATDGNNDFITLNGTTSGGVAGSVVHVAAILDSSAAKCWAVWGHQIATGVMVTPFGDAQL
tara:strand:- start:288 stop:812 length:525 start_codon:yes stop_codon:yes gene_type:complete